MPVPFAEAAKGSTSLMSAIIGRVIQQVSPISEYITVRDVDGHRTYTWFTDKDPGLNTWTSVNQPVSNAVYSEQNEFIVGLSRLERLMTLDKGLAKIPKKSEDEKAAQLRRAGMSYGLEFTNVFFSGNQNTNPKQPNGIAAIIQAMIANQTMPQEQQVDAGSGGAPLTLALMADLQSRVWPDNNVCFFMNRLMFLYYNTLIRDASAAGYYRIEEDRDMFGRPITMFGGAPVRIVMRVDNYQSPLGFTENGLALSGGSTTSIYCVSFDSDLGMFCVANGGIGMQVGPFVDLQIDALLRSYTYQEFSFGSGGPRSAARLYDISQPSGMNP